TAYDLFFFQAEDGIRDPLVTGVQTCALPISEAPTPPDRIPAPGRSLRSGRSNERHLRDSRGPPPAQRRRTAPARVRAGPGPPPRSEERRVGKEGRRGCVRGR